MDKKNGIVKLNKVDSAKVLKHMTIEELPEAYRKECWAELKDGHAVENWFVGDAGAKSYSGKALTLEEWKAKIASN